MNSNAPSTEVASNLPSDATSLRAADLKPAAGVLDAYDAMVLTLCDNSFVTEDIPSGDERFCHQVRHATNADTVYLCCRSRLTITATTSAANDINNDDTRAIHQALMTMVADLGDCHQTVQAPALRVFPDHARMSVSIVPVSELTLAIIVDPDQPWREMNEYCADAMAAVYRCQTAIEHEGFAPTLRQLQTFVFDELDRRYQPASSMIEAKRLELFMDDLTAIDITFDKLIEPQPAGNPTHWGYEAVPLHASAQDRIEQLYLTASNRSAEYQLEIDLSLLKKAAFGYKTYCENASLQHVDEVKPICVTVSLHSLQHATYITALREMIEMCVIAGSNLVFEVRDTTVRAESSGQDQSTLEQIVACLRQLRDELGIRVMLSDKVLLNASLTTLLALEPEFLKFNHIVSKAGVQPVGAMLEEFSLLAAAGAAAKSDATRRQSGVHSQTLANATPMEKANEAVMD